MNDLRKCPYCAEEIRIEAIKCKHCGSDLENKPIDEINTENWKIEQTFEAYGK